MKVLDPGHEYELASLDDGEPQRLIFVKREGAGYPGNVGHHPGTIMQEVLRALIERLEYVGRQIPCPETELSISHLKTVLFLLESRAARRHGRILMASLDELLYRLPCPGCGHVECGGSCGRRDESLASKIAEDMG